MNLIHEEPYQGDLTIDEIRKALSRRLTEAMIAADNWAADNRRWAWGDSVEIVMTEVYKLQAKIELALDDPGQYLNRSQFSDSANALIDGIYLQINTPATSWKELGREVVKDAAQKGAEAVAVAKTSATWGIGGLALAAGLYFLLSRRF